MFKSKKIRFFVLSTFVLSTLVLLNFSPYLKKVQAANQSLVKENGTVIYEYTLKEENVKGDVKWVDAIDLGGFEGEIELTEEYTYLQEHSLSSDIELNTKIAGDLEFLETQVSSNMAFGRVNKDSLEYTTSKNIKINVPEGMKGKIKIFLSCYGKTYEVKTYLNPVYKEKWEKLLGNNAVEKIAKKVDKKYTITIYDTPYISIVKSE